MHLKPILILLMCCLFSCQKQAMLPHFLSGTWLYEHDELFEKWTIQKDGNLTGYSYKYIKGRKLVAENLKVKNTKEGVTYFAQVHDQNNGQEIPFKMTTLSQNKVIFENPNHDFPKYISYTKTTDDRLDVLIKGGAKEFTFILNRHQKDEGN